MDKKDIEALHIARQKLAEVGTGNEHMHFGKYRIAVEALEDLIEAYGIKSPPTPDQPVSQQRVEPKKISASVRKVDELKKILFDTDRWYTDIVEKLEAAAMRGEREIAWRHKAFTDAAMTIVIFRASRAKRGNGDSYTPPDETFEIFDVCQELITKLRLHGFQVGCPSSDGTISIRFI